MKKHNIQNASAFATKQLGNKLNDVLMRKERQRLKSMIKVNWYLELVIAACCGAALALGFVIIHQMIVTEWTW
jgi:hypothetical protein